MYDNHEHTSKDVFQIAGDAPDPMGEIRGQGVSPGFDMTKMAAGHPKVIYRLANGQDLILEVDVYKLPNEPMYLLFFCPLCLQNKRQNALRIVQGNKAMSYDPKAMRGPYPGWTSAQMKESFPKGIGGLLSVEQFACTWEASPEASRDFGLARCTWKVVIDNNVARNV
jgi:hypothetical protein